VRTKRPSHKTSFFPFLLLYVSRYGVRVQGEQFVLFFGLPLRVVVPLSKSYHLGLCHHSSRFLSSLFTFLLAMGCNVTTESSVTSVPSTSNPSSHQAAATVDGHSAKSSQSHDSYLQSVSPPGQVATSQRQNSCEQQTTEGNCQRGFLGLLSGSGGDSAITTSLENCATNPLLARPMAVESATSIED
jgi:hypothetical protein